jgi:hypothetical protein
MQVNPRRSVSVGRLAQLALMPAAAFAVHQLRYWLTYGAKAGVELQRQGHSYLHSVVPWLVLLIAVALGAFLVALGRAFAGRCSRSQYTLSFVALWLLCAMALVAIYVTQEFLEGLFATGHPGGLAGIFGYGGWWSIPASLCVGLVLAAVFHGARRVLHDVAQRRAHPPFRPARTTWQARPPSDVVLARVSPLSAGWSGRGPPR